MYFTVTPVSELSSIAWTYVAKDYENIPDDETQQFEDMITWQYVPIVESQRPEQSLVFMASVVGGSSVSAGHTTEPPG